MCFGESITICVHTCNYATEPEKNTFTSSVLSAFGLLRHGSWWCHQMETFSALLALVRKTTGHRWIPSKRPVTRSFDVTFICARTKGWANNRDTGDLKRHRAHNDVTVVKCINCCAFSLLLDHFQAIHYIFMMGYFSVTREIMPTEVAFKDQFTGFISKIIRMLGIIKPTEIWYQSTSINILIVIIGNPIKFEAYMLHIIFLWWDNSL